MMKKSVLITGVAGFVGHALAMELLKQGWHVVGIDNLSAPTNEIRAIKQCRLTESIAQPGFSFICQDIKELSEATMELLKQKGVSQVVHLAANAGVREANRRSIEFMENNIIGFYQIIELARHIGAERFIYASSSTIYGNHSGEKEAFNFYPKNMYAVTKIADEFIAKVYAENYDMNNVGLRFFSVYGPYGRPDMAPWIFAKNIMQGETIRVSNKGNVWRDFTYIDDLVRAIVLVLQSPPTGGGYHVCDIGSCHSHSLNDMIAIMENYFHTTAQRVDQQLTCEEAEHTLADMTTFTEQYAPMTFTPFEDGITRFCQWLEKYLAE